MPSISNLIFDQANRLMAIQGDKYFSGHRPTKDSIIWSLSENLAVFICPDKNKLFYFELEPYGKLDELVSTNDVLILSKAISEYCDVAEKLTAQTSAPSSLIYDEIELYFKHAVLYFAAHIIAAGSYTSDKLAVINDGVWFKNRHGYDVLQIDTTNGTGFWYWAKTLTSDKTKVKQVNPRRDKKCLAEIKKHLQEFQIIS